MKPTIVNLDKARPLVQYSLCAHAGAGQLQVSHSGEVALILLNLMQVLPLSISLRIYTPFCACPL